MKKNFTLIFVLMFALAMTAGCGLLGSNSSDSSATTAATVLTLAGKMAPAAGAVASPGKNLAISASGLTAYALNAETNAVLKSATVSASGNYTLPISMSSATKMLIVIKENTTGKIIMSRYLGSVSKPTGAKQMSNCDVNEATTAKAALVQTLVNKGTTNLTPAEKGLINTPVDPDTVTDLATSDPVQDNLTSLVNAGGGAAGAVGTALANMEKQVKTVIAAISNGEAVSEVLTQDLNSAAKLATTCYEALKKALTNASMRTALTNASVTNVIISGAVSIPIGNDPGVVTETQLNANDAALTTATDTAAQSVPSISTIKADTYTIYDSSASGQTTYPTTSTTKPTLTVAIANGPIDFTPSSVFSFDVVETIPSLSTTTKTIVHGRTPTTGEMSWQSAFGTAFPYTTNVTTLTFSLDNATFDLGKSGSNSYKALVKVGLREMKGIVKTGTSGATAVGIAPPAASEGLFYVPGTDYVPPTTPTPTTSTFPLHKTSFNTTDHSKSVYFGYNETSKQDYISLYQSSGSSHSSSMGDIMNVSGSTTSGSFTFTAVSDSGSSSTPLLTAGQTYTATWNISGTTPSRVLTITVQGMSPWVVNEHAQ